MKGFTQTRQLGFNIGKYFIGVVKTIKETDDIETFKTWLKKDKNG
jgi:hypothetical protein